MLSLTLPLLSLLTIRRETELRQTVATECTVRVRRPKEYVVHACFFPILVCTNRWCLTVRLALRGREHPDSQATKRNSKKSPSLVKSTRSMDRHGQAGNSLACCKNSGLYHIYTEYTAPRIGCSLDLLLHTVLLRLLTDTLWHLQITSDTLFRAYLLSEFSTYVSKLVPPFLLFT